jgi:hypothetical protein
MDNEMVPNKIELSLGHPEPPVGGIAILDMSLCMNDLRCSILQSSATSYLFERGTQ